MTTARDDRKEDKQSQPHVIIASKHDDSVQMMGAEWHGTKSIKVTTAAASCAWASACSPPLHIHSMRASHPIARPAQVNQRPKVAVTDPVSTPALHHTVICFCAQHLHVMVID